jgi:hypothetical protein
MLRVSSVAAATGAEAPQLKWQRRLHLSALL